MSKEIELKNLEETFAAQGGRGVELADRIDRLREELALDEREAFLASVKVKLGSRTPLTWEECDRLIDLIESADSFIHDLELEATDQV